MLRRSTTILVGLIAVTASGCRPKPATKAPPPPPERHPIATKPVLTPLACVKDGAVLAMDGEGNHQRRLAAPGTAIPESLCWSGDTKRIAWWTIDVDGRGRPSPAAQDAVAGTFRLCVADVDSGGQPVVLYTAEPGLGGDLPAFSPDGKEVYASVYGGRDDRGKTAGGLYAVEFTRSAGLLRFPITGGKPQPLVERPETRGPLRWLDRCPDGARVLAVGGQGVGDGYLAIINLDTHETREYRDRRAYFGEWNPKTVRIAYFAPGKDRTRDLRVWSVGPNTTATVAAGLSPLATFCWSSGGQSLGYTNESSFAIQVGRKGQWSDPPIKQIRTPGSLYRWPTFTPDARAAVYEFHAVRDGEPVLKREALDPSVNATDLLAGAVRPLFAVPG